MIPKQAKKFETLDKEYSAIAKVMAHPARLAILKSLIARNNQTCQELVNQLPFTQSTVSQHLSKLKSVGLIDGASYKTATIFTVNQDNLFRFNQLFFDVFGRRKDNKQLNLF
jgi:predicted transcriptional regulator